MDTESTHSSSDTPAAASGIASERLLQRIAAGDQQAEQELVSCYWRGLYFVINHQSRDPELAADLCQDAFVIVIGKARNNQILNPHALSAFIRQVGMNLLIAHYRKENRHKTEVLEDIDLHFSDQRKSIMASVNQQKLAAIVQEVINELSTSRDRDILKQLFLYEKDKEQICLDLSLSSEHFDRVLYRARERLKQKLSLRLNIDLSEQSLSHLLSLAFLTPLLSGLPLADANKMQDQVGDLAVKRHWNSNQDSALAKYSPERPEHYLGDRAKWQR